MLRPKLPDTPPAPTAHLITSAVARHSHAPACSCRHPAAASPAGRPIAPYVGLGVAAVAAVIVVGVVLTALLAAVAITAVAVAIAAVVLRSLLSGTHQR
jgi:hypothetical protein